MQRQARSLSVSTCGDLPNVDMWRNFLKKSDTHFNFYYLCALGKHKIKYKYIWKEPSTTLQLSRKAHGTFSRYARSCSHCPWLYIHIEHTTHPSRFLCLAQNPFGFILISRQTDPPQYAISLLRSHFKTFRYAKRNPLRAMESKRKRKKLKLK